VGRAKGAVYGSAAETARDAGWFENLTHDRNGAQLPVSIALQQGHATFRLHGEKLQGAHSR
jgi:hypothetical protein